MSKEKKIKINLHKVVNDCFNKTFARLRCSRYKLVKLSSRDDDVFIYEGQAYKKVSTSQYSICDEYSVLVSFKVSNDGGIFSASTVNENQFLINTDKLETWCRFVKLVEAECTREE